MNKFSIIIPSKNLSNLRACVERLRAMGETARVIVIDDGIEDSPGWWLGLGPMIQIAGRKPFIFARNVNAGIIEAHGEDVVVMNDDALLETQYGVSMLHSVADEHPEYGVIAASVDHCGTPNQIRSQHRHGLREELVMLAFICVYIPRSTIIRVGLLDERFCVNAGGEGVRGYGCEDDDYCWRVRAAGLRLGVLNESFVSHTKLPSTFRSDKEHPADVKIHERLFQQKWGVHPRMPKIFGVSQMSEKEPKL